MERARERQGKPDTTSSLVAEPYSDNIKGTKPTDPRDVEYGINVALIKHDLSKRICMRSCPPVAAFRQDHKTGDEIRGRPTPNLIHSGYYVRKARRKPLLGPSVAVPALDRWSLKFLTLWRYNQ